MSSAAPSPSASRDAAGAALDKVLQAQSDPTQATVYHYNKNESQPWGITTVTRPATLCVAEWKRRLKDAANAIVRPCSCCSNQAYNIVFIGARGLAKDGVTVQHMFFIVDSCLDSACLMGARALVDEGVREAAEGSTHGTFYRCAACDKVGTTIQLCTRCKCTHYCNVSCQRAGWAAHKEHCLAVGAKKD